MTPKYVQIAESIKKQVINGDFGLKRLPSGRTLAAEAGVSYLTARRAVQHLLEEEVFVQKSNGRLELNQEYLGINKKIKVALIRPNWHSPSFQKWLIGISQAVKDKNGIFKTVSFSHIDDPVIHEVLEGDFDLIFLDISNLTPSLERKLKTHSKKVIGLFHDWTDLGISCIDGPGPESLRLVVEHFYRLGHRKVSFLATEPSTVTSDEQLVYWNKYIEEFGMESVSIIERVEPFGYADIRAYDVIKERIKENKVDFTAMFCRSVTSTNAAMRAFFEGGYKIGEDMSIAAFGDKRLARFSIPSITIVDMSDPSQLIKDVVDYACSKPEKPRMFRVIEQKLKLGESTGKCPE